MSHPPLHSGHCRCGGVELHAHGEPFLSVYCHCDDCRRSTGSPVLAAVGFENKDLVWKEARSLGRYVSGTATRLFCNRCGSPVAQLHESAADKSFINTGFMDDPAAFPPTYHTFSGEQLPWLELADSLPRTEKTLVIKTD